jgi:hypothetical protein
MFDIRIGGGAMARRRSAPCGPLEEGTAESEAVQDDAREKQLRELYGLTKPQGAGRMGTDAVLEIPGYGVVEFELKSATRQGVSTARDVGLDHLEKWRGRHWLVGFFDARGISLVGCRYASPKHLEPWIVALEAKLKLDFDFATVPGKVDPRLYEELLREHFGDREVYTLADAKRIQKNQYAAKKYRQRMDVPADAAEGSRTGYSRRRMLEMLAERWVYLTKRGATLNNPHIGSGYYSIFPELTIAPEEEARRSLRLEVAKALETAAGAAIAASAAITPPPREPAPGPRRGRRDSP